MFSSSEVKEKSRRTASSSSLEIMKLSGPAAWLYRLGIEALLGFHKEGDTLRIEPVIPPNWDGYLIEYRYGNSLYKIQIHNPQHLSHGVCQLTLDGEDQPEPFIHLHDDGREHRADLRLVPTT